jgi:hypothetical protein
MLKIKIVIQALTQSFVAEIKILFKVITVSFSTHLWMSMKCTSLVIFLINITVMVIHNLGHPDLENSSPKIFVCGGT